MLPLFAPAPAALPAPLATYHPATVLPDWPARVEKLRQWQQRIASGYVTSQKEEALQAEFLTLVFGQALGYEHERPDYRQLLLEKKTNVDGTKPDGALGDFGADGKGALGGPVRAVVELKDARTLLDAKQKLGLTAPLTGKLALTAEWKPWSTALGKALGRSLNLPEKGEWLQHFEQHQQQQAAARQRLARLDADLDQLVYRLYQLTPAEIALVEGGGGATPGQE
ncbi:hypothetical protein [Hymenobacter ruricola]|uniref:Restriction endonuclease subunit M n=1 Tax=Hymenobacter ruricola TaxID=2791023 RepID=A0ABS0IAS6_9BACT|nr:hypothetical protein [Hymenobacter ruricola]MBF9224079.1 hypothetical protein [Hymenobacter ruricola]